MTKLTEEVNKKNQIVSPFHNDQENIEDHGSKKMVSCNAYVSVVVPLYNEEGNVAVFVDALTRCLKELEARYEVILVDDGSQDQTWSYVRVAGLKDSRIKGVSLSRNFGHQNAIFTGLHYASGNPIITMDGDMQHPPETIADLYEAWRSGYKVVETMRIESKDSSVFKRYTSRWFYKIFSALSGLPMTKGTSDFRLIDRQVAEAMKEMRDADLFLRGIAKWVGFPRTTIEYQAADRYSGRTKFSLFKMIRFSIASLLSFSLVPLRLGMWLGVITSFLAFLELAYILVRYFQGGAVSGWASIMTVISFMFGILFILVGLLGTYLGSIFETVKNRPRFLVNETSGFSNEK